MQHKLKSVFRRSSKSRGSPELEGSTHHIDPISVSSDQHSRTSVESSVTGSPVYKGRSRPVSSIYDDRRLSQVSARNTAATDLTASSDSNGGAIANNYKAYLPDLSPVDDNHGDEYMSLGGDRRHISGESGRRHEEDVADRNIARFSTPIDGQSRGPAVPPHNKSIRNAIDEKGSSGRSSFPPETTTKLRMPDSENNAFQSPQGAQNIQTAQSGVRHATMDGTANGEETELATKLREDGIVDLRNTTDTDGDITWAPAITHEVVKPHQHEIVQQKIYREIHNYEHFHRIQPVMMTEVLPPRHWIPNPNGEGLIEVSADELPARTGENRWWSICEHSSPYALQKTSHKYRTEPEIIEAGTFMTEEGFERKETIIIHPPTLADLTGYGGLVQAVHFDHETGECWMGELTTMDKLHELQQSLNRAPDAFQMDGLNKSLPKIPKQSMPLREPVNGHSSAVHGTDVGMN
ncbi:hypothetical protein EJ07DRAFT_96688 [Lizonia empirigonia]|nr:hypothetical protein EJ07DRAFT_96688 [Lizonia empirigonia]